jgi:hypothetical protein
MKISISLIEQAPVGQAQLSGPRSVYAPPLDYKRERAPVRTQGPILGSSSGSIQTSSSNTHRWESGREIGKCAHRLPPGKCQRVRLGTVTDARDP